MTTGELDAKVIEITEAESTKLAPPGFRANVNGWWIKAEDEQHAERIVDAAKMAYALGAQQARRDIRRALGLRDWGGEVSCLDR